MDRIKECIRKVNTMNYINCTDGKSDNIPSDTNDLVDDDHIAWPHVLSEGLIDDDHIACPHSILDESIEIDTKTIDDKSERLFILVPMCDGFMSHEHRFGKPPPKEKYHCSLCLGNWIRNPRIFAKCKNCEYSLCERCYELDVIPFDK